ncbi:acetate/propionate family kinase [Candidatus Falkowbacteria bacterium]|nr:acetate/propionate family kinase [Candidatus Falkowbacteria bacterium]
MTLIINAGSSSLKFKLFNEKLAVINDGIVEKIGLDGSFVIFGGLPAAKQGKKQPIKIENHEQALKLVFSLLKKVGMPVGKIKKVGHRIVHGGSEFVKPTLLNKKVVQALAKYNKLAPLHNPAALLCVRASLKLLPKAKQIACFDTMFYKTLPDFAFRYALPEKIYKKFGLRKYGFHGLSHEYVAGQAAKKLNLLLAKINLITCHLGSGCSITAIKNGKAIDTSMGFTPLEGLMMGTRCGDIDPALGLFLVKNGLTPEKVDSMFNNESGWLGVSGFKDLRDILTGAGYNVAGYKVGRSFSEKEKASCKLALRMFVYRVKKYIGAYAAVLGKVDAIVFTAGIGERNADVRKLIMRGLLIKTRVLVVPTNEELQIAKSI